MDPKKKNGDNDGKFALGGERPDRESSRGDLTELSRASPVASIGRAGGTRTWCRVKSLVDGGALMTEPLGHGLYTYAEAALLTDLRQLRVRA